jgi:DNA anti-recombination protein RmuC
MNPEVSPLSTAEEQVLVQMDRDLEPPQTPLKDELPLHLYTRPQQARNNNDSSSLSSSAAGAVPEQQQTQMLEQFSKQLKRLEENHQAERATMEQELQGQISRALDKQRQELAAQTQASQEKIQQEMTQELDEQRYEWKRQKENYILQLDSLTRERDGTQELLDTSQKEKTRMYNGQLKELRQMEKKMNVMEAEKDKHELRVKELEVSEHFEYILILKIEIARGCLFLVVLYSHNYLL